MKTGIELIADERQRQIEKEGWTPEHDDLHTKGELVSAAICYAHRDEEHVKSGLDAVGWPWEGWWFKPTPNDRVRELVKAGALLAAEIDRLQRIKNLEGSDSR